MPFSSFSGKIASIWVVLHAHRKLLVDKGLNPEVLAMTATPIPRTLELTTYGSMSVSKLTEKPTYRKEVITLSKPEFKINEVIKLSLIHI